MMIKKTTSISSHSINLNDQIDINADGINDLAYVKPSRKRPGFEEAVYLTFISSQEALRTAMFAVIQEQYNRGVYPSGIIGINPDDKFIVSKYEGQTAIRATIQGLMYGDYVLDSQQGVYQKVTGSGKYRNARNVDESDLENISTVPVGSYFLINEFDEYITPAALFNALPEPIKNSYLGDDAVSSEQALQILNQILEQYDLIETVADFYEIGVSEEELAVISSSIKSIELQTLVLVNRMFLSDIFAEYCPPVQKSSDDVAYILPLLSCIIGGEEEPVDDISALRAVATTYNDYISQRATLQSEFSKYFSLPIPSNITLINNPYNTSHTLKLGIYGKVDNNWGSSIKFSVAAVVFVQIESTQVTFSGAKTLTLLPKKKITTLSLGSFQIGPVSVSISCPLDFGMDAEISGSLQSTSPMFIGFTGLYGAGGYVGANYGISWKKILFISIPTGFYFNPFAGTEVIREFTSYAGPSASSLIEAIVLPSASSASAAIIPYISIEPDVALWHIIHGKVGVEAGLKGKLLIEQLSGALQLITQGKKSTKGTFSLEAVASLYYTGYVGIDETILGIRIKFGKEFSKIPIASNISSGKFVNYQLW